MKLIYISSLVLFAITACKKEEKMVTHVDISFSEPSVNDTIASYNQIHVEGTISADGDMEGYAVSLINSSNDAVLFTRKYDVQAESYNFHEHWTNNVSDTTPVLVRVEAIQDKKGSKASRDINVVCLP